MKATNLLCSVVLFWNGAVFSQAVRTPWNVLELPLSLLKKDVRPKYVDSNQFGDLYLLDDESFWLAVVPGDGTEPETAGGWGDDGDLFSQPSDVAAAEGLDVLVCDNATHRILRFDRRLNFIADLDLAEFSRARFNYPFRIAQNEFGEIMVATWGSWEIGVLSREGRFINTIGDATYGEDRFSRIDDMGVGPDNELAIIDGGKGMFLLISREGRIERRVPLPEEEEYVLDRWKDRWLIVTATGTVFIYSPGERSFLSVPSEQFEGRDVAISDCTVMGDVLYAADTISGTVLTTTLKFIE